MKPRRPAGPPVGVTTGGPGKAGWRTWVWPVSLAGTLLLLYLTSGSLGSAPRTLSYSQLVADVTANRISTATINDTGAVTGTLAHGGDYVSQIPTAISDNNLAPLLTAHNVTNTGTGPAGPSLLGTLFSFLPFLLLIGFYLWFARRSMKKLGSSGGGLGGLLNIGKSKAKVYDQDRPTTRFSDVAGYEASKAEVMEVVDFLKRPQRYADAGAKGPRGVLMVGPPGTGKTLLARAVAGEAGVPFFALSGSSFVEMFVGVGAARVRSLFEDARKQAPSIIFIDEIDAIGGRRSSRGFSSNDEREQTLNQLLSDMDGFEPGAGVVVIAATNRAESLDPALLRPGRFDRTVEIPLPNVGERAAILAIHGRGKTIGADVDLVTVARSTPGFSGADLANLVNEAAINAVRADRTTVTDEDFQTARDRILLGHRDASDALLPAEKDAVAIHEAGHALVAKLSEHADPVAKVTILPRGAALGATSQLPEFERHLYPHSYLTDSLAVRMGGRAAELVVLGEASTGAANDLASATELATHMVREWGLSAVLGPVGYGAESADSNPFPGRSYAEATQRSIDVEVAGLLRDAESAAIILLQTHRDLLDEVISRLLERESIDGGELQDLVGGPRPDTGQQRRWLPQAAAMSTLPPAERSAPGRAPDQLPRMQ